MKEMTSAQISLFIIGKHLIFEAAESAGKKQGKQRKKSLSELKELGAKGYEKYVKGSM